MSRQVFNVCRVVGDLFLSAVCIWCNKNIKIRSSDDSGLTSALLSISDFLTPVSHCSTPACVSQAGLLNVHMCVWGGGGENFVAINPQTRDWVGIPAKPRELCVCGGS